jgi:phage tail sheath protein FI
MAAGSNGAAVTDSVVAAAWDAFKETDQVDVRIMINGGYSSSTVQIKMNEVAKYRGDAVAILDLPSDKQKLQLALDYRNLTLNINSNRCALYGPDVYINDQYNGKKLFVPPSGHVAAQLVYTDKTTYPWFAAAGLRRGLLDVLGVRYKYGKIERDELHDAQVNYIRNLPGLGIAIWEQRTMQGTLSALSFLCVRRLFDNLELTIARAQQINLFEPNDDFTKLQVKTMCDQYLELVKRARGIKKYLTVCDNRDNPALLSANGQLRCDVFVEPTLPAEKIVLRFNITQQGVDFQELIAAGALN